MVQHSVGFSRKLKLGVFLREDVNRGLNSSLSFLFCVCLSPFCDCGVDLFFVVVVYCIFYNLNSTIVCFSFVYCILCIV